MGDDEWMSRLGRFAASGVWPTEVGNRPAPRQKSCYGLYQKLMLWMPYHLWKARMFCPTCGKQLTGYDVHKRARKVLDIDLMVRETLRCTVSRLTYPSSSQTALDQCDLPHQKMFRLILTQNLVKVAADG
ncbi:hypothetical protein AAFF_G00264000 [Aldrovandia affinis]|uniref:DUF6729 domain-containing protein n=1 Tax=Aldrovandia affinis TaxID=143900 RepID=A0AAD7SU20_9TELE|nr:hypothetical protein AAFF_G00264000 [Aldrovandia affinis]